MLKLEVLKNKTKITDKGKPPILFVHGMWHGAWCWEPNFLPYFEKLGYNSYALSLSNHANSPKRKSFNLLSINDYVKDLKQIIDSFNETPILIGHSMGGFIIQKYLEKNNVPGAVLIAPAPPFGVWGGTINILKTFPLAFLKANLTLNLKHVVDTPDKYKRILCSDNIKDEDVIKYHNKTNSESFWAYLDMLGLNLVKTKKVKSLLLIIGGGKDNVISEKALRKTCEIYEVSPIIFNEMGHLMMLEPKYKKVADRIDNWICNELLSQ